MGKQLLVPDTGKVSPSELLDQTNSTTSSRIFENLKGNPVFREIMDRKDATYRDLSVISSVIIANLDETIAKMEREQRVYQRIKSFGNAPIFAAAGSEDEGGEPDEVDQSEFSFIKKYATFRNFFGALIVVVGGAAAFFSWLNQDYNSILDDRKERLELTQENLAEANEKARTLQESIDQATIKISTLGGEVAMKNERIAELINEREELTRKLDAQQTEGSEEQRSLLDQMNDIRTSLVEKDGELETAEVRIQALEKETSAQEETIKIRGQQLQTLDNEVSKVRAERNKSVDSWNQLITFLTRYADQRTMQIRRSDYRKQLKALEKFTEEVPLMQSGL